MTTNTTVSAPGRSATRTRDLVLAALAQANEPVTVTELAEAVGVGKSTLAKHLPALEKEGLAVRIPGGREGRRRLPDTWQTATPEAASSQDISAQEDGHAETEANTVSTETDTAQDTAAEDIPEVGAPVPTSATPDTLPQTASDQTPEDESATADDQGVSAQEDPAPPTLPRQAPTAVAAKTTVAATRVGVTAAEERNPISGSTRLAPGELKLMVKAVLDHEPGEEFSATAISHLLQGRSIGAIQNNLARLAKEGKAVQTSDKPRRYRSATHPA